MLANYHTHTSFCDGKNSAEEIVLAALEAGFDAIGFSGHGFTAFDLTYCMKDTDGYLSEIARLKNKYKKDIEIYAGVEEDAAYPLDRTPFDYTIGSSHYFCIDGSYYPIDSRYDCLEKCVALYGGDTLRMTEDYYSSFCHYIERHRPDVVGHFDLLTKFDEQHPLFLPDARYRALALKYARIAASSGAIFEVNTGAISRGYRTTPYPHEELLFALKNEGARVMLSSDSHNKETLAFGFAEAKSLLREVGFTSTVYLYHGAFVDMPI